jgi:hypothetical protein
MTAPAEIATKRITGVVFSRSTYLSWTCRLRRESGTDLEMSGGD